MIPPTSPPVPVLRTRQRTATRSKFSIATVSTRLRRSDNTWSEAHAARFRKHPSRATAVLSESKTASSPQHGRRCTEFLLSLAVDLARTPNVYAIACDTDGIDGSEDNAGAVLLPESLVRGARLGLDARKLLADNDAYGFFSRLEDLVVTGPTRTNVNDYRAILIR